MLGKPKQWHNESFCSLGHALSFVSLSAPIYNFFLIYKQLCQGRGLYSQHFPMLSRTYILWMYPHCLRRLDVQGGIFSQFFSSLRTSFHTSINFRFHVISHFNPFNVFISHLIFHFIPLHVSSEKIYRVNFCETNLTCLHHRQMLYTPIYSDHDRNTTWYTCLTLHTLPDTGQLSDMEHMPAMAHRTAVMSFVTQQLHSHTFWWASQYRHHHTI